MKLIRPLLVALTSLWLIGCCCFDRENPLSPEDNAAAIESAIRFELNQPEGELTAEDLAKIESLDLSFKWVVYDLSPLAKLPALTHLNLNGNAVSDLSPLTHLKTLHVLGLTKNHLTDLTPLTELPALRELHLQQNQITDPSPLGQLTNLKKLDLSVNPIPEEALEKLRQALPECKIHFTSAILP